MSQSTQPTRTEAAPGAQVPALGKHVPMLDGLRGLAILVVMCFHSLILRPDMGADANLYLKFMQAGWMGVDLFFVLSGFLITGILHDSKGTQRYFITFYARRSLRIFPLYYLFLIFALFIAPQYFAVTEPYQSKQLYTWLYVQNLATWWDGGFAPPYHLSHLWSLAIEEQFYMVWPLVVFWLSRLTIMRLCGAIIVFCFVLRCLLIRAGVYEGQIYSATFCRLDTLAVGAWIALALRGPSGLAGILKIGRLAAVLGGAGILGVFAWQRTLFEGPWLFTIGLSAVAVFFGGLLVLLLASNPHTFIIRALNNALLRSIGRYSYAMYLFHLPIQLYVSQFWFTRQPILDGRLPALVGQLLIHLQLFIATYLLAMASWWLFEKHFLKLKRLFEYNKAAPAAAKTSVAVA